MRAVLAANKVSLWQFVKFCAVGVVNTLVGYGVVIFTSYGLGLDPYSANICGYAVGLMVSFTLNRRFTFRSQQAVLPGIAKFLAAFAPSYGLNLLVLHLGLQQLQLPEYLAQAFAMASYSVTFFILCRFFVFRPTTDSTESYGADTSALASGRRSAPYAKQGEDG